MITRRLFLGLIPAFASINALKPSQTVLVWHGASALTINSIAHRGFPSPPFTALVDGELVTVTNVGPTGFTLSGTQAASASRP